ncbi:YaaC family protein [Streptacidiphilus anmyonensis]|uniref:YaaC family protein n=1 Tax=Streptacidiphilus anmyonensis TaxID=405782 RepID=UPI0006940FD6|nr:YaaC family protein [Streptacidiphilus anmyonensis]
MHTPGGVGGFAEYTPAMFQRWIRGLRADPPGAAGQEKARKETFSAALEQAEQLFAAARVTDAMVRPLLVYYGLNQAGRAIAAAASTVPNKAQEKGKPGEPWKLAGHGLGIVGGTNAMNGLDVADIPIVSHKSGAFPQLAEILGSGSLIATRPDGTEATPVTVGQIWETISDTIGFSLPGPAGLPALAFDAEGPLGHYTGTDLNSLMLAPVRRGQESGRLEGIPRRIYEAADQRTALKEFLDRYPTLGGYQLDGPDGRLGWVSDSAMSALGMHEVRVYWNLAEPVAGQPTAPLEERVATPYRGQHFAYPALGDNPRPLHPLLAWWAVLYALSMLARYEPCAWNKRANIDSSKEAVPIEHLLEAALDHLPRVILDTIDEISRPAA